MAEAAAAVVINNPSAAAMKKKKRSLPGTPDPEAEVIALSPRSLMATNRFVCEICGKGFQREQNLQLHRRGHNLPWRLRQREGAAVQRRKRVYVCPERSCVHHNPSRALGDLTGIKKHFCRKHGEKRWRCDRCAKRYAVQSDWKAHAKTCGTREYRCNCGTIFSRRDSFVTHRAFCDALALETARVVAAAASNMSRSSLTSISGSSSSFDFNTGARQNNFVLNPAQPSEATSEVVEEPPRPALSLWIGGHGRPPPPSFQALEFLKTPELLGINPFSPAPAAAYRNLHQGIDHNQLGNWMSCPTGSLPSLYSAQHQEMATPQDMSATALLQKAAQIGVVATAASCVPPLLGGTEMVKCSIVVAESSDRRPALLQKAPTGIVDLGGGFFSMSHPSLAMEKGAADGGGGETRDFLGVDAPPLCATQFRGWI